MAKPKSHITLIAIVGGVGSVLLLAIICICVCIRRKRLSDGDGIYNLLSYFFLVTFDLVLPRFLPEDTNENKAHPDHIQAGGEPNGFVSSAGGNARLSHKSGRLNGVVPRMNITSNPMASPDGDKVAIFSSRAGTVYSVVRL